MDQSRMVTVGRELVDALSKNGLPISAAVWVLDSDRDAWKLWIALGQKTDLHAFYSKVAQTIAADRYKFSDLDAADTKLVAPDHPAIRGLRKYASATGASNFRLTNNMLEGFYLTDGVVVSLSA